MQVVVVNAPGAVAPHWSLASSARLCAAFAERGVAVTWLRVAPEASASAAPAGVDVREHRLASQPLHRVAAADDDPRLEIALTALLRPLRADAAVVHVGAGAGGSPNLLWIADRLGLRAVAHVRGEEVVCRRGDLVHRDGSPCDRFDDAERCRRCCASGWQRPHVSELQNRFDLLMGSLLVAERVFVASSTGVELLVRAGVPQGALVEVGTDAAVAAVLDHLTSPVASAGSRAPRSRSPRSDSRS